MPENTLSINIFKARFTAFHGVHAEERIVGGEFEIDLTVKYTVAKLPVTHLHESIDYTVLFSILKTRMSKPTPLLETIATEISQEVLNKFLIADDVNISITKLHPPIENFKGSVGVSFHLKRER